MGRVSESGIIPNGVMVVIGGPVRGVGKGGVGGYHLTTPLCFGGNSIHFLYNV